MKPVFVSVNPVFYDVEPCFRISHLADSALDRIFPSDFVYEGERHDFWEAVYVIDGKLEITEDEKVYLLGPRDIIFHAPNEFHRLSSAEGTCPHVLNISFSADTDLPQLIKDGVFNISHDMQTEYMNIFSMMLEFAEARGQGREYSVTAFELSCRYSAFIMRLLRESSAKERISFLAGAQTYRLLVELMQKEVLKNISLKELSQKSFVSVSYIKKIFVRYAGISPKSYYINLRVAEALRLLHTDMPVSDISDMMGFSSPSYFVAFLKKNIGCTPTQYRRNI